MNYTVEKIQPTMLSSEEREAFNNQIDRILDETGVEDLVEVNRQENGRCIKAILTVKSVKSGELEPLVELAILPRHRFRVRCHSEDVLETFYRRDDTVDLVEDTLG